MNDLSQKLRDYAERSASTDRINWRATDQVSIHLLGAMGEFGSVLSEVKKHRRDGNAHSRFKENLTEELGDLLWYVAALARRAGISLALESDQAPAPATEDEALFALGKAVTNITAAAREPNASRLSAPETFPSCIAALAKVAEIHEISLQTVIEANIRKTNARWAELAPSAAPIRDANYPVEQRLPRDVVIDFRQYRRNSGASVTLRCNEIAIGDRLTDNAHTDDGYRFHDAFHLAHAAVVGWSPVTRALFRCKRRDDPTIDEVEDGARAQIAEEALSFKVFDYARDRNFLANLSRVDQDLLKRVTALTRGLECESTSPAEWELAILQGYEVFRQLRANEGGQVHLDADNRRLSYIGPLA